VGKHPARTCSGGVGFVVKRFYVKTFQCPEKFTLLNNTKGNLTGLTIIFVIDDDWLKTTV